MICVCAILPLLAKSLLGMLSVRLHAWIVASVYPAYHVSYSPRVHQYVHLCCISVGTSVAASTMLWLKLTGSLCMRLGHRRLRDHEVTSLLFSACTLANG